MDRVAVFIDGGYLDQVLFHEFPGKKVDYYLLTQAIVNKSSRGKEILRIYYYHCLPYQANPPTEEQKARFSQMQRFFRALQRTPKFEVRQGRLAFRGINDKGELILEQKRIDLMIGLDLILLSTKRLISEAFLISGDSDLLPSITAAKAEGIIIHLVHGSTCHQDLLDEADERIQITAELISSSLRMF